MATSKIEHAKGLYLDGIRDGKIWDALNAHTGDRYTQHSTGVADGKEGFAEFFGPFLERNPDRDIQVVREIEDGSYVFLHVYQNLGKGAAQWVTGDLFDTDENDKVVEHWDVIQEFASETVSGRTMLDGPSDVEDLDKTDANKAKAQEFCDVVLVGGQFDRVTDFISVNQYDQHNPAVGDGLDGFGAWAASLAEQGLAMRYWKVHKLIGQGSFVVTLSHVQIGDSHYCVFDIFRLKEGLIVEHWDIMEKILPPEQWNNQGKF